MKLNRRVILILLIQFLLYVAIIAVASTFVIEIRTTEQIHKRLDEIRQYTYQLLIPGRALDSTVTDGVSLDLEQDLERVEAAAASIRTLVDSEEIRTEMEKVIFHARNLFAATLEYADAEAMREAAKQRWLRIIYDARDSFGWEDGAFYDAVEFFRRDLDNPARSSAMLELRDAALARRQGAEPVLADTLEELIETSEEIYLLSLETEDRTEFLRSSGHFVLDAVESSLAEVNGRRESRLHRVRLALLIMGAVGISALAVIFIVVRRYLANFLSEHHRAISSLENEEYHYTPLTQTQDEVGDLLGALESLSARLEERSRALIESEQRHRSTLDGLSEIVFEVDPEGKIVYLNHYAETVFGVERELVIGTKIIDMLSRFANQLDNIRSVMAANLPVERVAIELVIDGTRRTFEVAAFPVGKADGGDVGYRGTAVDITDRLALEERLRHAEKMEAVGQLAGGVAHDFNNQLSAILGYTEMLRLQEADESMQNALEGISVAVHRAADVTGQLLTFARRRATQSAPMELHGVIHEVESVLESALGSGIDLEIILDADPSTIVGDASLIQNMLLNLCLNARDAMQHGGTIRIATEREEIDAKRCEDASFEITPGPYVMLSVSDTGCGIPEEVLPRIFEPFYTTKEVGKGTGMGLAAVYGTVSEHRGMVEVDSSVGSGTSIRVYLPASSRSPHEAESKHPATSKSSATVLVIDDDRQLLDLQKELLESLGHTVSAFSNPREAIPYFREHASSIDCVILDMIMPDLDGGEVFNRLLEIDPEVRVLIVSGYSIDRAVLRILEQGCHRYLKKPFSRVELDEQLTELLRS